MSSDTWVVPPPFGQVGNYANLPTFALDSTVNLQWQVSELDTTLWLLQDGDDLLCTALNLGLTSCQKLLSGNRGNSWDWHIGSPTNYSASTPVYYLQMRDVHGESLITSHYINILPANQISSQSTTSSSSSSTITTSSTSLLSLPTLTTQLEPSSFSIPTTSLSASSEANSQTSSTISEAAAVNTASSTTATAASASSTSTQSSSASNTTLKVAAGVGVGVGVPLVIALVAIAWLLFRRQKQRKDPSQFGGKEGDTSPFHTPPMYQNNQNQRQSRIQELPGQLPVQHEYYTPTKQPYNPPVELS